MEGEVLSAVSLTTGFGAALLGILSVGFGLRGMREVWRRDELRPNDLVDLLGYFLWFGFGLAAVAVGGMIVLGGKEVG